MKRLPKALALLPLAVSILGVARPAWAGNPSAPSCTPVTARASATVPANIPAFVISDPEALVNAHLEGPQGALLPNLTFVADSIVPGGVKTLLQLDGPL